MDCCVFFFFFSFLLFKTYTIPLAFSIHFISLPPWCSSPCQIVFVTMSLANVNSPEHVLNGGGKKVWLTPQPPRSAQMEKMAYFLGLCTFCIWQIFFCVLFDVVEIIITVSNQTLLGWDMKSGHGCPFGVKFLNLRTLLKEIHFNSSAMNAITRQKAMCPDSLS